jgi:cyclic pyranopterin phosphate synthase
VELAVEGDGVRVRCEARARYGTGVEMEALCGCTGALLCIWDMVKYLEKDASGNYPSTAIKDIHVVQKVKGVTARRRQRENGR